MSLFEKLKNLFRRPALPETPKAAEEKPAARPQKACKKCGKMFSYDPSWEFVPNYCRKFFTFPNTVVHYPNYCPNCRKSHQAAMKAKYNRKPAEKNKNGKEKAADGNRQERI